MRASARLLLKEFFSIERGSPERSDYRLCGRKEWGNGYGNRRRPNGQESAGPPPRGRFLRRSSGDAPAIGDRPFRRLKEAVFQALLRGRPCRDLRRDPPPQDDTLALASSRPTRRLGGGSHPTVVGSRHGSRTMRPRPSRPRSGSMRPANSRSGASGMLPCEWRPVCPRQKQGGRHQNSDCPGRSA